MDNAIPISDLKAVFGDYEKTLKTQSKVLNDLYKILTGDKTLPSTNRANSFYAKLNPEVAVDREEKDQKKETKKSEPATTDNKKTKEEPKKAEDKKTIPQYIGAAIGSALKVATATSIFEKDKGKQVQGKDTPFARESINIEFTPKAKVELEDIMHYNTVELVDKIKPYFENLEKTLHEIKKDDDENVKKDKKPSGSLLGSLLSLLGLGGLGELGVKGFLKKKIGDLFRWVGSKIWNSIKWVGKKALDAFKWVGRKAWEGLKWVGKKAWEAFKWIGNKTWDGIKRVTQKMTSAVKDFGEKVGSRIKSVFNSLKNSKWVKSVEDLGKRIGSTLEKNLKSVQNTLSKRIASMSEALGNAVKGLKGAGPELAKDAEKSMSKVSQASKELLKGTEELAEGAVKKGKLLKGKGGVVGAVVSGGIEAYEGKKEVDAITAKQKAGLISKDEATKQKAEAVGSRSGKFAVQTAAGTAGAWAGAEGGALVGAAVGSVVPVLGTAIGAAIGGFIGGVGGYMAGSKLADVTGLTKAGEEGGKKAAKNLAGVKEENKTTKPLPFKEGTEKPITLPAVQPTTPETPANNIQPAPQDVPSAIPAAEPEDNGPDIGDVHDAMKEQNKMLASLIKVNKQTAENTAALMAKNNANNVSVVNVSNNPTAYLTNPVGSTDIRRKAFGQ